MDQFATAGAFATIVGLLCNFKSEKRAASSDEYKAFIEWISEKKHDQLVEFIQSNILLSTGIKNLLHESTDIIIGKIDALDIILAKIATQVEGLSEIAKAIRPHQDFSKQCASILKQMNDSGASAIMELKQLSGLTLLIMGGQGSNIAFDEPRFIEDDLRTLLELGMLRLSYGSSGSRIFHITRAAISFLNLIKQ